jgi:Ca-activated chloride channel family protein
MDSASVAAALNPNWDVRANGDRPDVWAPDAATWLTVAAARPEAAQLLPTVAAPSLASTPAVLAMQKPKAQALGWPAKPIAWSDILANFVGGQGWERLGHPDWGPVRVGLPDPTHSIAGLGSVVTTLDLNNDNTMSDQEILGGVTFSQLVTTVTDNTASLFEQFLPGKPADAQPAAFPALERDLARFIAENPATSLVPIYPAEGVAYADYPYVVLNAPWIDQAKTALAASFLAELNSDSGRKAYATAGFRDATHASTGSALLSSDRGFVATPGGPTRKPNAQTVSQLLGMWAVLQRPNNVLVALDTSGSMGAIVPAAGITRMQMLQRAASQGISLLNNQSVVGLWQFATNLTPTTDYRELVPVGKAGDMLGPYTRRQAMAGAILGLQAQGDTGLYDTILAAYQSMQSTWQANAQNVLVIITDGKNDDPQGGLTLDQVTGQLKALVRGDRPLTVIGIAVGDEADAKALETITAVTGGHTFVAKDDVTAIQQVVLAFAGRIS